MESTDEQIKASRYKKLELWLASGGGLSSFTMAALPGDASFRRYFRIYASNQTYIAMDAPTPQENCFSFVAIARALRKLGLNAPDIIAGDIEQGFLLLTDFGDLTMLKAANPDNADLLYGSALQALSVLQGCNDVPGRPTPPFTREFMWQEWAWHKEWFLEKLLGLSLGDKEKDLDDCYSLLVESAATQPQVFMHRDYHSANLMILPNTKEVGILDFQDAFIGPVTYDLASLLRDCYIAWPETSVTRWAIDYWETLRVLKVLDHVSQQTFLQWFDWMGMQRHLKALLTFARKHVRDSQSQYLQHIPRTLNYLLCVSRRYPELAVLHDYLQVVVAPAFKRVNSLCER